MKDIAITRKRARRMGFPRMSGRVRRFELRLEAVETAGPECGGEDVPVLGRQA